MSAGVPLARAVAVLEVEIQRAKRQRRRSASGKEWEKRDGIVFGLSIAAKKLREIAQEEG